MSSQPAFSVCIPNYNYERFVAETIRSVLDQTYRNFEVVVVDNCSTDGSWEAIASVAATDSRIRCFRNPYNVGFGPNLDRAAGHARNEFIIVLSSDDLMRPTALAEYAAILSRLGGSAEKVLISSEIDIIDAQGAVVGEVRKPSYISPATDLDTALTAKIAEPQITVFSAQSVFKQAYENIISPCAFLSTCYSRKLYNAVGGFNSIHPTSPDAHLVYKALSAGNSLVLVEKKLFFYRVHGRGQFSSVEAGRSLNALINHYLLINSYTPAQLQGAKIDKPKAVRRLVGKFYVEEGIRRVGLGQSLFALQHLCFALAAYPGPTARRPASYLLALLLVIGPFGKFLVNMSRRLVQKRSPEIQW